MRWFVFCTICCFFVFGVGAVLQGGGPDGGGDDVDVAVTGSLVRGAIPAKGDAAVEARTPPVSSSGLTSEQLRVLRSIATLREGRPDNGDVFASYHERQVTVQPDGSLQISEKQSECGGQSLGLASVLFRRS